VSSEGEVRDHRSALGGPLAWFARNGVAANVLMLVLIVGGIIVSPTIKREVFPEFDMDIVSVSVVYPGASPHEVENGVTRVIEEQIRGLNGVKHVSSISREGVSLVLVELLLGADAERMVSEVESAVSRITSFPEDIEEPTVSLLSNRTRVLQLMVYGDHSEKDLRAFAEKTREGLLADDRITFVSLSAVRPIEIGIEVPQDNLRQYNLTLDEIAQRIRQASVELPGGGVKTAAGEKLLRTVERRDTGAEFGDVTLLSTVDGTQVRVRDLAEVTDGFAETDQEAYFNGKRAAIVDVFRVGNETPITVSQAVKDYVASQRDVMPAGMNFAIWADTSEWYESRVDLLTRNALIGLVLVLLVLGLFLEIKLAFWVMMGIPISFIGALLFLPMTDVSINMISLFAFIVVLGMVVDDAIVVGEAVYTRRCAGVSRLQAAIEGVREVATPVAFAIATTVIAFSPMLFVPGPAGKFFRVIPIVVILVLLLSLVESLFILPAHLAHSRETHDRGLFGFIHHQQQRFSRAVEWMIQRTYVPTLKAAVRNRYLTVAIAFALLIAVVGLVVGGRVETTMMPKIEQDIVIAEITLSFGSSIEDTKRAKDKVLDAAYAVLAKNGGEEKLSRGVFAQVGAMAMGRLGDPSAQYGSTASHLAEVAVNLVELDKRDINAATFARQWREAIGELPNLESLKMGYSAGAGAGPSVDIELSHNDVGVIERAAADLAAVLATYRGVRDIDDGFTRGKEQLDFTMKPEGLARGLSAMEVGRQVRSAFYGAEVLRQQRGRDELKVFVRLPRWERDSEYAVERLLLRTPQGEVPLDQAAMVTRTTSYTAINRLDGRRVVNVTADTDPDVNADGIMSAVLAEVLPGIAAKYSGLRFGVGGQQRQWRESTGGLFAGFGVALVAMIALLAIAFRSYIQWAVIMGVIPFGIVGAILGHLVMGYDLSLMSFMGIVALSGVVVNDSLIFIVAINEGRQRGDSVLGAVEKGGARRFRPIILTSLTTFFGLMPMILEQSVQARFLIPMAISLGFGVIFATFVTLLLVPAVYVVLDDLLRGIRFVFGRQPAAASEASTADRARLTPP
jgi:multidrug efflux pump subunit AcrB